MPTEAELKAQVSVFAERLEVPGVAVGVVSGDEEHLAFAGVTSVEDPLPIDEGTLFQTGSTGTTSMRRFARTCRGSNSRTSRSRVT
jgi:hypothetical protein